VAAIFLYFIAVNINNFLPENGQIPKRVNDLSSLVSSLIIYGIILGLRSLIETLGSWFIVLRMVSNDKFYFAIMAILFYPLHKIFLKKFKGFSNFEEKAVMSKNFKKIYIVFIGLTWGIAFIFLSIPFLQIPMTDPDIFNLGFIWTFFAVGFDISFTFLTNMALSNEKRIPKEVLRDSMIVAGIIAFGIWSIQLIIFELYLSRLLGLVLFQQDIRLLIIVVTSIYVISFFILKKFKFMPKAAEESKQKLQNVLTLNKINQSKENRTEGNKIILDVKDLTTYFYTEEGVVRAVEGVSLKIYEGEVLGLVGETGCGKSVTALSILQVVRPPGVIEKGKVIFGGEDLLQKSELEVLKYRGKDITMIFQDPLNSLNPVFRIGSQISEVYLLHMENELLIEASKHPDKSIYSIAREWSEQLLRDLNIPFPEVIFDRYPHELSGGMRQRVQIAMALACSPKLLIADEPTTALDVTIQNQILKLMKDLKKKYNTSILFITHDLGIISKMCDRVAVMYSGFIVEYGEIKKLFLKSYHPYTRGLIASVPVVGDKRDELEVISGMVPNLIYPPSGCRFHPRCQYCFEPCNNKVPKRIEVEPDYFVACHLYDPEYKSLAEISIKKAEEDNN
jgi:oligopeptide/dipeptide ABC transporter ATP-binding protein